jgi:glycerophosphoryl diester phosphodiesterase
MRTEPAGLPWDFPFWVAHRGAGKLAPENTLAAFRVGAQHGYRAFECDVKLSRDGQLYLMHDPTLERCSNWASVAATRSSNTASEHDWAALAQLDAGGWHSRAFVGEPLARMQAVVAYAQANGMRLNLEIKPSYGMSQATGRAVALACAEAYAGRDDWPLLSSFDTEALAAAHAAAPQLPRALLMNEFRDSWLAEARQLQCSATTWNYSLWSAQRVQQAHAAGLKALSYTVNDPWAAQWLIDLGTDGIITDAVDRFSPHDGQRL